MAELMELWEIMESDENGEVLKSRFVTEIWVNETDIPPTGYQLLPLSPKRKRSEPN